MERFAWFNTQRCYFVQFMRHAPKSFLASLNGRIIKNGDDKRCMTRVQSTGSVVMIQSLEDNRYEAAI